MKPMLLTILKDADGPMTAAAIACKLDLPGKRETQRRHVRALIKQLRDDDKYWIIALGIQGYFLTSNESIWRDYVEGRAIDGKRIIAEASSKKKIINSKGQFLMFQQKEFQGSACQNI